MSTNYLLAFLKLMLFLDTIYIRLVLSNIVNYSVHQIVYVSLDAKVDYDASMDLLLHV